MNTKIAKKLENIKATSQSREESLEKGWRYLINDYITKHPELTK